MIHFELNSFEKDFYRKIGDDEDQWNQDGNQEWKDRDTSESDWRDSMIEIREKRN